MSETQPEKSFEVGKMYKIKSKYMNFFNELAIGDIKDRNNYVNKDNVKNPPQYSDEQLTQQMNECTDRIAVYSAANADKTHKFDIKPAWDYTAPSKRLESINIPSDKILEDGATDCGDGFIITPINSNGGSNKKSRKHRRRKQYNKKSRYNRRR
jgi:hypothetical protein